MMSMRGCLVPCLYYRTSLCLLSRSLGLTGMLRNLDCACVRRLIRRCVFWSSQNWRPSDIQSVIFRWFSAAIFVSCLCKNVVQDCRNNCSTGEWQGCSLGLERLGLEAVLWLNVLWTSLVNGVVYSCISLSVYVKFTCPLSKSLAQAHGLIQCQQALLGVCYIIRSPQIDSELHLASNSTMSKDVRSLVMLSHVEHGCLEDLLQHSHSTCFTSRWGTCQNNDRCCDFTAGESVRCRDVKTFFFLSAFVSGQVLHHM